jgi:cysteine synthase A
VLDLTLVDEIVPVTEKEAIAAARELAGEGIACGISSGAAYHVASQILQANPGKTVVTILPDSAERYRSIGL